MRKILLGLVATAAIASPLAAATAANAETVTTVTGATFTAVQPAGEYNQWSNLWVHDYAVTINPDGTFTGSGVVNGHDSNGTFTNEPETVSGRFTDSNDADSRFDHVTFTAERTSDHVAYTLTNAPMGTGNIVEAAITVDGQPVQTQQPVEFKVDAGVWTEVTVTNTCTPSAAVNGTFHTEYQWAALVAKPRLHWEYKYTDSPKNPSTDLAHIWVKSLDLSKKGWPQVTQQMSNNDAKAAVECKASGDVNWKYGDVTGTLVFNANADGGTLDYTDSTGQTIHGDVDPGTVVKDGTKTTFTGKIATSNVEWNHGKPFTVVIDSSTPSRVGVFVHRTPDNILADVTSGSITIN